MLAISVAAAPKGKKKSNQSRKEDTPALAAVFCGLVQQGVVNATGLCAQGETHLHQHVLVKGSTHGAAIREGRRVRLLDTMLIVVQPHYGQ